MAAWLAYLKSRILLPETKEDEEATGPALTEALTFQLRRLDAMRDAGEKLIVMPRLGRDVFARGAPEGMEIIRRPVYEASLYDMLKAYGDNRRRTTFPQLTIEASQLFSLSEAIERLRSMIGNVGDWTSLTAFLPDDIADGILRRSAVASTFAAGLELVKEGKAKIRQSSSNGPIYLKREEAAING